MPIALAVLMLPMLVAELGAAAAAAARRMPVPLVPRAVLGSLG